MGSHDEALHARLKAFSFEPALAAAAAAVARIIGQAAPRDVSVAFDMGVNSIVAPTGFDPDHVADAIMLHVLSAEVVTSTLK